jgi:hypothetical protein
VLQANIEEPAAQTERPAAPAVPGLSTLPLLTLLAIVLCGVFHLHLAFVRQVNWDEFYFLSRIHEHGRETLATAVQTMHVHLFGWLAQVPGHEIDQIVAARTIMLLLLFGTAILIHRVSTRFLSQDAALLAVLSYLSCGYVLSPGASFRFDPISAFLLMLALALLLTPNLRSAHTILAGLSIALAGLVTIKSVFYLPTIVAVSAWRLYEATDRGVTLSRLSLGATATVAGFIVLYLAHSGSLAGVELSASQAVIAQSYQKTIILGALFPGWPYLAETMRESPATWILIAVGLVTAIRAAIHAKGAARRRWLVILAFAVPLTTLAFYRNGFPYFHGFLLAPVAVLAGVALDQLNWPRTRWVCVALFIIVTAGASYWMARSPGQAAQRATVDAVHAIFPEPVDYIDRCSMIGSFQKLGFFMSSWGIEDYRAAGRPIFRDILLDRSPAFLLANGPALEIALTQRPSDIAESYLLFPEDAEVLRANFVPHWGPIWVAGKALELERGTGSSRFEILISGSYTVEAEGGVLIDHAAYRPGDVVVLSQGWHGIRAAERDQTVILRWGAHLHRPPHAAPDAPVFRGF